ncbi:MAG TPA: universal stress protein [Kofleriaceae bacterium]|nr:universal stress protein [Kofleriaceae bacterium]
MTEPRHRIVVALDLGEYSEIVLEHALDQAARHDGPDLHFVYVHDDIGLDVETAKQRLAALVLPALEVLDCTEWRIRLHVRAGKAPAAIAELAGELGAHLIVLGRFGTHHPHRRLGTVAARVIDLAPCATLVVGLEGSSEAVGQCPDCVEARASSDGARWFCAAHTGDRTRLSTMVVPGASWLGGLMW